MRASAAVKGTGGTPLHATDAAAGQAAVLTPSGVPPRPAREARRSLTGQIQAAFTHTRELADGDDDDEPGRGGEYHRGAPAAAHRGADVTSPPRSAGSARPRRPSAFGGQITAGSPQRSVHAAGATAAVPVTVGVEGGAAHHPAEASAARARSTSGATGMSAFAPTPIQTRHAVHSPAVASSATAAAAPLPVGTGGMRLAVTAHPATHRVTVQPLRSSPALTAQPAPTGMPFVPASGLQPMLRSTSTSTMRSSFRGFALLAARAHTGGASSTTLQYTTRGNDSGEQLPKAAAAAAAAATAEGRASSRYGHGLPPLPLQQHGGGGSKDLPEQAPTLWQRASARMLTVSSRTSLGTETHGAAMAASQRQLAARHERRMPDGASGTSDDEDSSGSSSAASSVASSDVDVRRARTLQHGRHARARSASARRRSPSRQRAEGAHSRDRLDHTRRTSPSDRRAYDHDLDAPSEGEFGATIDDRERASGGQAGRAGHARHRLSADGRARRSRSRSGSGGSPHRRRTQSQRRRHHHRTRTWGFNRRSAETRSAYADHDRRASLDDTIQSDAGKPSVDVGPGATTQSPPMTTTTTSAGKQTQTTVAAGTGVTTAIADEAGNSDSDASNDAARRHAAGAGNDGPGEGDHFRFIRKTLPRYAFSHEEERVEFRRAA